MRQQRYRMTERTNNADAARDFGRNKVEVVFRSRTSVVLSQLKGSSSNPQTSADPTALVGQSVSPLTVFPQPKETSPAFLSADCCVRNPKVKWSALERSPNVSHAILSHGLPDSRQHIAYDCL